MVSDAAPESKRVRKRSFEKRQRARGILASFEQAAAVAVSRQGHVQFRRAEGLQCDSLGWSESNEAQAQANAKSNPQPCKGETISAPGLSLLNSQTIYLFNS
jgi:hypothetical protein